MAEQTVNFGNIPPIGSSQIASNPPKATKTMWKPDVAMFDNTPNDVSIGSFWGKVFIWWIVWICVAALLFGTLSAIGWITTSNDGSANPMLKILLPIIWFVVSFVWNLALAGLYNIFFSRRYYNFGKMFGLIFASSLILFVFFFAIYSLFSSMSDLYRILWFQIIFGLYVALNLIDFLSQPNYSASSMMWNTLWCVLAVIAYLLIIQLGSGDVSKMLIPIIISSVAVYAITVFGAGIWDAIYYKFYEWGSNPFYLPSLNELREERQKEETKKEKENEEVNVEMK